MNTSKTESFWSLVINYGLSVATPRTAPDSLRRAVEAANTWALAPALGQRAEPSTRRVVALGTAAESILDDLNMTPLSLDDWDVVAYDARRWAQGRDLVAYKLADDPARPGAYVLVTNDSETV